MSNPNDRLAMDAIEPIESGMVVGLGTGRTASRAVRALADHAASRNLNLRCVPTSAAAEALARDLDLETVPLPPGGVDYLFDGADEFDDALRLLKGGGGALTREKIVAASARRRVYLVQDSKRVSHLGERCAVPVEVVPFAASWIEATLARSHAGVTLRSTEDGAPLVTDNANHILDLRIETGTDPQQLARELASMPGVVEHGLFLTEADTLLIENAQGAVTRVDRAV